MKQNESMDLRNESMFLRISYTNPASLVFNEETYLFDSIIIVLFKNLIPGLRFFI